MPHVTQAEFAKLLGKSKPYINNLVSKGILSLEDDGKLDYDASVAALKLVANPGPQLRRASEDDTPLMQEIRASALNASPEVNSIQPPDLDVQGIPSNYQQARALRERFAALNERLKFERDIGRLVDADGIARALQDILATLRVNLDLVPDRCIADLPIEAAHPLRLKIAAELDAALQTVREQFQGLLETQTPPIE